VSEQFGPYTLLTLLGKGGMGEVWRAHDTATDRVVALKLLPSGLADDDGYRERFLREAQIVSKLNNPFVVPIHRYGTIDGRLYVDMRLVEGRDLAALLADGPLAPARAVAIVEQVAKALNAAHRQGLVHRDVKPSNVLVTDDDFAYLIDFGIARDVNRTGLTGTGTLIGTWSYMAPERMMTAETSGPSCDVYSLACVLHECLTAARPFPGDSVEVQVAAHLHAPPPHPSRSTPTVPVSFDHVVDRGMAKDPRTRYQTTLDLAGAARHALDTGVSAAAPTQAGPPPTVYTRVGSYGPPPITYPPPTPGGSKARLVAGIAVGLAVLAVAAAVAVTAFTGGDAGTSAAPATSSPTKATSAPTQPAGAPGEPVRIGDLAVTVTGTGTRSALQGKAPTNGEFYVVNLSLRNQGTRTATYLPSLCHLITDATSFQGDAGAAAYLENGFMPQIQPGDILPTAIAFDVPAGTEPTAIEFDADLLPGGGVRIPLS
jgi:predicted Ser/Thr protein kinase